MVDEKLRILAEQFIEQLLVLLRAQRNVAHRVHTVVREPLRDAAPHAPEIRNGAVTPQLTPELHFVKRRDTHAVFVRRNVLRDNIHRDLAEEQVGADAGGGGDAGRVQNVEYDFHRKLTRRKTVGVEVAGDIYEYLVD